MDNNDRRRQTNMAKARPKNVHLFNVFVIIHTKIATYVPVMAG